MTFKHTTPNHSSESLSTFRTYFRTYKRLTLTGILAVMSVLSITYAATRITSITQTATKGDSITAEWVNEVNAALQGSAHMSGSTHATTNISISGGSTGCYPFKSVAEFEAIIQTVGGKQPASIGYSYYQYKGTEYNDRKLITHTPMEYRYFTGITTITYEIVPENIGTVIVPYVGNSGDHSFLREYIYVRHSSSNKIAIFFTDDRITGGHKGQFGNYWMYDYRSSSGSRLLQVLGLNGYYSLMPSLPKAVGMLPAVLQIQLRWKNGAGHGDLVSGLFGDGILPTSATSTGMVILARNASICFE